MYPAGLGIELPERIYQVNQLDEILTQPLTDDLHESTSWILTVKIRFSPKLNCQFFCAISVLDLEFFFKLAAISIDCTIQTPLTLFLVVIFPDC
jgi:hypothetical protein